MLCFAQSVSVAEPQRQPAEIAWTASGEFCEPETVLAMPDDTLLVSNVCGFSEPGNGYLTLLDIDGNVIDWRAVDSLDSPLGMAFSNDRLFVVDGNRVRIFGWPAYAPIETIPLSTSVANDIAVAGDGTIYVSDSATHQVIRRRPDGGESLVAEGFRFGNANGLQLFGNGLYVGGEYLWRVDLTTGAVDTLGADWLKDIDGIEFERDGTLQATPVGGPLIRYRDDTDIQILDGDGVSSANHGYARRHRLALIPTGYDNTVIAIQLD